MDQACKILNQNTVFGDKMIFKKVLRYDPRLGNRKFRLFRLLWTKNKDTIGKKHGGHSAKLAIAIKKYPLLFKWQTGSLGEWRLIICGIDIHYRRSYGGTIQ
jgi:hypothetical protein